MHIIAAYKPNTDNYDELATLVRHFEDPLNIQIYKALKATEYYNTESGSNEGRIFHKTEILQAKRYIENRNNKSLKAELIFLSTCLTKLSRYNKIFIYFTDKL